MSKGILLVNLGSPKSPTVKDVKPYLREFLMDKYVIDLPYILRWFLINGIILNKRQKKSALAYQSIWWEDGSPLIVISKKVQDKLSKISELPVGLGMRYAEPSIQHGIQTLIDQHPNITELVVVPLYPHYAMASTKTVIEKTNHIIKHSFPRITPHYVDPWYNYPNYIDALTNVIQRHISEKTDYLLFSYHGLPVRHVKKTDPSNAHCFKVNNCCTIANKSAHSVCYPHQVKQTTQLVMDKLLINQNIQYSLSFQSRLGSDEWLQPFTDHEIKRLAQSGTKHLAICSPAFVSDCLETLEEIGKEGKKIFLDNGGESFTLIPCLNDNDQWIECLHDIIKKQV